MALTANVGTQSNPIPSEPVDNHHFILDQVIDGYDTFCNAIEISHTVVITNHQELVSG
jgi:hypothetical protein